MVANKAGDSPMEPTAKRQRLSTDDDERLPVTVLSGFLGAGKTSVLQNILHSKEHGLRIAVIVNDMAAVNVDAKAVVQVAPKLVAMQNGCICCTLREDLLQQVADLAKEKETDGSRKWQYLVIESTGISEPLPVAQTFIMELGGHDHHHHHHHDEAQNAADNQNGDDSNSLVNADGTPTADTTATKEESRAEDLVKEGNPLLKYSRLDTMVTVVDACGFFDRLTEIELIKNQPDAEGNEDEDRTLADLMIDQVEFANVILLNKCDLMADNTKELESVEKMLKRLNPGAEVIRTTEGKAPFNKILNTHLFDMDKAEKSAGWIAELSKPSHTPETEEYGVSSLVFRATKPFHPRRLADILNGFGRLVSNKPELDVFLGVLRSKGQIWLANAMSYGFMWHSAGRIYTMQASQNSYISSLIENTLKIPYLGKIYETTCSGDLAVDSAIDATFGGCQRQYQGAIGEIERLKREGQWSAQWGDRSQELVLIGVNLDKPRMKAELEKALLTDEEMAEGKETNFESWNKMEDAFFGGRCQELYWDLFYDAKKQTGGGNNRHRDLSGHGHGHSHGHDGQNDGHDHSHIEKEDVKMEGVHDPQFEKARQGAVEIIQRKDIEQRDSETTVPTDNAATSGRPTTEQLMERYGINLKRKIEE